MIKPLGDRVLVEPLTSEEKTVGGIYLPDTAQEKPQEGKIIAVGSGKTLDNGEKVALSVKKGDNVIYSKYGGTEIKHNQKEYLLLREDDILAIVEKEEKGGKK